jgi:hypothetical protein
VNSELSPFGVCSVTAVTAISHEAQFFSSQLFDRSQVCLGHFRVGAALSSSTPVRHYTTVMTDSARGKRRGAECRPRNHEDEGRRGLEVELETSRSKKKVQPTRSKEVNTNSLDASTVSLNASKVDWHLAVGQFSLRSITVRSTVLRTVV